MVSQLQKRPQAKLNQKQPVDRVMEVWVEERLQCCNQTASGLRFYGCGEARGGFYTKNLDRENTKHPNSADKRVDARLSNRNAIFFFINSTYAH